MLLRQFLSSSEFLVLRILSYLVCLWCDLRFHRIFRIVVSLHLVSNFTSLLLLEVILSILQKCIVFFLQGLSFRSKVCELLDLT